MQQTINKEKHFKSTNLHSCFVLNVGLSAIGFQEGPGPFFDVILAFLLVMVDLFIYEKVNLQSTTTMHKVMCVKNGVASECIKPDLTQLI